MQGMCSQGMWCCACGIRGPQHVEPSLIRSNMRQTGDAARCASTGSMTCGAVWQESNADRRGSAGSVLMRHQALEASGSLWQQHHQDTGLASWQQYAWCRGPCRYSPVDEQLLGHASPDDAAARRRSSARSALGPSSDCNGGNRQRDQDAGPAGWLCDQLLTCHQRRLLSQRRPNRRGAPPRLPWRHTAAATATL